MKRRSNIWQGPAYPYLVRRFVMLASGGNSFRVIITGNPRSSIPAAHHSLIGLTNSFMQIAIKNGTAQNAWVGMPCMIAFGGFNSIQQQKVKPNALWRSFVAFNNGGYITKIKIG